MAKQILEGLWDCPYCKSTAIGGLTKHCPCCGHPQDEGTRFYLGTAKKYLDADLAAQYGQGADWVCPYCGSYNRVHYKYCTNCAAPKEESKDDYFSSEAQAQPETETQPGTEQRSSETVKPRKRLLPILLILALVLALVIGVWPHNVKSEITGKDWMRSVQVEKYTTLQESDWAVPSGGRVYRQITEIHHFTPVLDHYETRTRQVPEQVYDGEDYHTNYVNNGDGTFTEETWSTPRYRTEYRTETYQEPVYRQEPIYGTKYYYEIDRWIPDREETNSGSGDEPGWPQFTLAENEREGGTRQRYTLTISDAKGKRNYTVILPEERWNAYHIGDHVTLTVSGGSITKLDGEPVS